jgi:beta-lactamase class A
MNRTNVFLLIFISAIFGATISFLVSVQLRQILDSSEVKSTDTLNENTIRLASCDDVNVVRESDFKLVKPLLLVNVGCESRELGPLKNAVSELIQSMKNEGRLTRAGVYFKELNTVRWTTVNDTELFYPGSLLKVALAIHILKLSESNPALLDKKIVYDHRVELKVTEAPNNPLIPGKEYSVSELIDAAIADSNNDAVTLLFEVFDKKLYEEMFSEIGVSVPDITDTYYQFTATDFSKFFRILYNATYLNHDNSEYCMNLLLRCNFMKGITRDLPNSVKVAHKFGERYTADAKLTQFHEAGVVYAGGKPYVISIMTEGLNHDQLMDCVARISKLVYDLNSKNAGTLNQSSSPFNS